MEVLVEDGRRLQVVADDALALHLQDIGGHILEAAFVKGLDHVEDRQRAVEQLAAPPSCRRRGHGPAHRVES